MLESELFPIDDLGYSALEDAEVVETDEDPVRRVVASCPERALSVRS
jgi:ferredoxin